MGNATDFGHTTLANLNPNDDRVRYWQQKFLILQRKDLPGLMDLVDPRVHCFSDVSLFNLLDAALLDRVEDARHEPQDHPDDCH